MENRFYNDFDREIVGKRTPDDLRSPFEHDRDRIIYTSAFRRLQAKTQVFKSGEYDFYRTRLTHSIEVAQIGRGICNYLYKQAGSNFRPDFYIDPDLVEACCLAHDIGHPPFGHAGETSLNRSMRNNGGFEGNAQTLRLLTEIIYSDAGKRTGMSPTRAFLDGVMKYKALYGSFDSPPEKHFLYDEQRTYLDFAGGGNASEWFRNSKSIECQIMEWADDVAYSVGDVIDGIRARFITVDSLTAWSARQNLDSDSTATIDHMLDTIKKRTISKTASLKIGEFIKGCSVQEQLTEMDDRTNRYHYNLVKDPSVVKQRKLYGKVAKDLVFNTAKVHQLEYKADQTLRRLFDALKKNYICRDGKLTLLPAETEFQVRSIPATDRNLRARLICDHIAGMSDDFPIRTHQRLFDAGFGSIVDLV